MSERFTVYIYDRRGRHESGDSAGSATHALERETEDLDAVVAEAGGTADVFGHPSGAVIALEAARARVGVTRLALYEAPLVVDTAGL